MSYMYLFLLATATILQCEARKRDRIFKEEIGLGGGPIDIKCPVEYKGLCFDVFVRKPYNPLFTRETADAMCKNLKVGHDGHLANVYDKRHFNKLISYIMTKDISPMDPNLLLGMTYNVKTKVMKMYDDSVLTDPYWGASSRPLYFGRNMVIRASTRRGSSKLQNYGDDLSSYTGVVCEYSRK